MVEKETVSEGNFFNCCTGKCRIFKWLKEGESSGEHTSVILDKPAANDEGEDFSFMF